MVDWMIIQTEDSGRYDVELRYKPILVQRNPGSVQDDAVQIGTDRPVNAINFSLSASRETGSLEWRDYDKKGRDASDGSLQELVDSGELDSDGLDQVDKLFGQVDGSYVVNSWDEKRNWLKMFVCDEFGGASWKLEGPSWMHRRNLDEGTPIFVTESDVEPDNRRPFESNGFIRFNVGRRL